MKFEFEIEEQVSIWHTVKCIVEAESKEEIMEYIKNGDLLFHFDVDMETIDRLYETEVTMQTDYSGVCIEYIEEIL